jgi:hypothetical protein
MKLTVPQARSHGYQLIGPSNQLIGQDFPA